MACPRLPAWPAIDVHARWAPVTGWGTTTVVVGLNNLLDEDPPMSARGSYQADPSTYDFQGRQWFLRLAQGF